MKHPFPCQCVETIRLNNSLNRNSYTTRSFTLSSHPRTSERFLAAQSSVVHHGNDCNVQWCAICPCELPAVYHTATLDRCALVGRWKVWETGALDGECGGAAHIHATAGMFCTKAQQTSSSYFICIAFSIIQANCCRGAKQQTTLELLECLALVTRCYLSS